MQQYKKYHDIDDILARIALTPGRNDKIEILESAKDVFMFKEVLKATYNPFVTYNIKKIPNYDKNYYAKTDHPLGNFMNGLDMLSERIVTGNKAIKKLQLMFDKLPPNLKIVGEKIINRDLSCGFSASTINKVFPSLISTYENMLCESGNAKNLARITYPCVVEEKMDGMRCNISMSMSGEVIARSRGGKTIDIGLYLSEQAQKFLSVYASEMLLDGELMVLDEDKVELLSRKKSNGICNKAIKGTITDEQQSRFVFTVWDIIPVEEFKKGIHNSDLLSRLDTLQYGFEKQSKSSEFISMIKQSFRIRAQNETEVAVFYDDIIQRGGEGVILKNLKGIWEGKRSKDCVKMKVENEADLRIIEVLEGAGRLSGKLGAFTCITDDGELSVRVGSGFSDIQREEYFSNSMINEILTVKYNEVISSKGKKTKSLFLPIFVEIRKEKDETNKIGDL